MSDSRGFAWLLERFGADGLKLRRDLPAVMWDRHLGMADAQKVAPMRSSAVYGQMWRAVHDGLLDSFANMPSAQLYRPVNAPYKLVVINGTVLFPWRYADNTRTDLDQATLGPQVSSSRRAALAGAKVPDMLPFGDLTSEVVDPAEAEEVEKFRQTFRAASAEHPVVAIPYASNMRALLSLYWGDVKSLRSDGSIDWGYREQFDLALQPPPKRRLRVVGDEDKQKFNDAPLAKPKIRPRRGARPAANSGE
jgi:hypothetical protein